MVESLLLTSFVWYLCGFCLFIYLDVEPPKSLFKGGWMLTIWPIVLARLDK